MTSLKILGKMLFQREKGHLILKTDRGVLHRKARVNQSEENQLQIHKRDRRF